MKKILILLVLFMIVSGCTEPKVVTDKYFARVKRVVDGDTIELEDTRIVRYIGVDTPEIRERVNNRWVYNPRPYALEAKEFNRSLVENKEVMLEFDVEKKDKYGRLLAYVYEGEKMVNLELVKEGYAMIYTAPPNVKYVEKFIAAQQEARNYRKGLWADLEKDIISYKDAKKFIGRFKVVEGKVKSTYLSKKILILKFSSTRNSFKAVIFNRGLSLFKKRGIISPSNYYKGRKIKVFGLIKKYKEAPEIIVNDPAQIEIID